MTGTSLSFHTGANFMGKYCTNSVHKSMPNTLFCFQFIREVCNATEIMFLNGCFSCTDDVIYITFI